MYPRYGDAKLHPSCGDGIGLHPCSVTCLTHLAWATCMEIKKKNRGENKNKWHHLVCAAPSHLQRWSPQQWLGAARQWRLCQWNFRLHDWTQSCHLLLQNQARSSPTPDENQRTSSCCRGVKRRVIILCLRVSSVTDELPAFPAGWNYCTSR